MNLSLKTRLWMPTMALAVLVVFVTVLTALRTQGLVKQATLAQQAQEAKLSQAMLAVGLLEADGAQLAAQILNQDAAMAAAREPAVTAAARRLEEADKALSALLSDDEEKGVHAGVHEQRGRYLAVRGEALKLKADGQAEAALGAYRNKVEPALAAYVLAQQRLKDFMQERSATLRVKVGAERMRTVWLSCGACWMFVVLMATMTIFLVRSICPPLASLAARAQRIGGGDLSLVPLAPRRDEVGQVQAALDEMAKALRQAIGQVREVADGVFTASGEIASGNADLSQRTEHTASNLQVTSAAVEQLNDSANRSQESAQTADRLAVSAAEVASRGGQVVSQVVSTMNDIQDSSRRIADIIGVIDGIAFQTNILALNAAVEAARAGDQGRGFAVVASEVRSLAQRSAEAAREIKALIGGSVERVEAGSRLVQDAGATMNEIVSSVRRVTDVIGEITAAAAEQRDGLGQVNGSVVELDRMTQQNAALVEQSAAAAQSVKDQAERLAAMVGSFRLQAG